MNYSSFLKWEKYGQRDELIEVFETIRKVKCIEFSELTKLLKTFNLGSEKTIRRMIVFYKFLNLIDIERGKVTLKYKNSRLYNVDNLIFFRYCDLFFKYYPVEKIMYLRENINGDIFLAKSIPLKYSNFRNLAISFNKLLYNHETCSYNFVSSNFSKYLMRKKSLESLEKNLENQKINGLKGEQYVVKYEKKRLNEDANVVRISDDNVTAGYDIKSFDKANDIFHNRFIEVKTYSHNEKVYITRNEINVSKLLGNSYYLYVVDLSCVENEDYEPLIIKDLHKNIISNETIPFEVELITYNISDLKN